MSRNWIRWSPLQVRVTAAVAAVLVVVLVVLLMPGTSQQPSEDPVSRGDDEETGLFRCDIAPAEAGGHRLSWPVVDGAVSYQVAIFSADHTELASIGVGRGTSIELETPPGTVYCRVVALRGGEEIARSAPAYLAEP